MMQQWHLLFAGRLPSASWLVDAATSPIERAAYTARTRSIAFDLAPGAFRAGLVETARRCTCVHLRVHESSTIATNIRGFASDRQYEVLLSHGILVLSRNKQTTIVKGTNVLPGGESGVVSCRPCF